MWTISQPLLVWLAVLAVSAARDVDATAYLRVAVDRSGGLGFFSSTVLGPIAFPRQIIAVGHAMKIGPAYIATVGVRFERYRLLDSSPPRRRAPSTDNTSAATSYRPNDGIR